MRKNVLAAVANLSRPMSAYLTEPPTPEETPLQQPIADPVEEGTPAQPEEASPADPTDTPVGADPQGEGDLGETEMPEGTLDALRFMATMPRPVNNDDFTPGFAMDIIQTTRDALGRAVAEIDRMRRAPGSIADIYQQLTTRFAERREEGYIAKQFIDDGGLWTIFAHNSKAIAFAPDRDTAILLVHTLSGMPVPGEDGPGSEEDLPSEVTDPADPAEPEDDDDDDDSDEVADPVPEDEDTPRPA